MSRGAFVGATISFLKDFASQAGRAAATGAGLMALGAVFEGIGLVLIVPLLSIVTGAGGASGRWQTTAIVLLDRFGATTPVERLALLLTVFAVLMIVRAVVVVARDTRMAALQIAFVERARLRIAESLMQARWQDVAALRAARVTHFMSGDIHRIGTAAQQALQCMVGVMMLVVQAALAVWLAPLLSLVAIALVAVSVGAMAPVLRRARDLGTYFTQAGIALLASTSSFLSGLKLAKAQNLQEGFASGFRRSLREFSHRQVQAIRSTTTNRALLTTLSALVGSVLVLAGYAFFHLPAPTLVAFLVVVARMSGPVNQIQQGAQIFANALPAYEALKVLEHDLSSGGPAGDADAPIPLPVDGVIEMRGVSYWHADHGGGVTNLTLAIEPGEFLGIAGPSGAGKTTIADLLVGLYSPQSGQIRVGSVPLTGGALTAWRDQLSYVAQESFLFHDTVRANLLWANARADDTQLWEALAVAGADKFVGKMGGLGTVVGESGTLVSGGERQRLALARALLRDPALLVLDEATSAIDVPSELAILARIRDLHPRATIVVIAHRRESLSMCDRVVTVELGRLIGIEDRRRTLVASAQERSS